MQTYYIKIERQGWTLAIVRVQATSYEEARVKALEILHQNDDIFETTQQTAVNELQDGSLDYIIDEKEGELELGDLEERGEL